MPDKKEALLTELQQIVWHEGFWASINQNTSTGLTLLAILASIGAGIAGLLGSVSSQKIGIAAFIPGALALVATTMNFDGKAKFHNRKKRAMDALLGRLKYQMPDAPTDDQISLIHKTMSDIDQRLGDEWDSVSAHNWAWAGTMKSATR
jgi:hypothetical protein